MWRPSDRSARRLFAKDGNTAILRGALFAGALSAAGISADTRVSASPLHGDSLGAAVRPCVGRGHCVGVERYDGARLGECVCATLRDGTNAGNGGTDVDMRISTGGNGGTHP